MRNKYKKLRDMAKKYFKENKEKIISNLTSYSGIRMDEKRAFSTFYNDAKFNYIDNFGKAKKEIKSNEKIKIVLDKTLNRAAYTSEAERNFINLKSAIRNKKDWENFRSLNRHQKLDFNKLKSVQPTGNNVRSEFLYNNKIHIQIIYYPDGSWDINMFK